jgi:hypothetical protein
MSILTLPFAVTAKGLGHQLERVRDRHPMDPNFQPLAPESSRDLATDPAENDFEQTIHAFGQSSWCAVPLCGLWSFIP